MRRSSSGRNGTGRGSKDNMRRDPLSSVHDQCMTKEREEVPMAIVGGLDVHRRQITFDYLDTETGQVRRGRIPPAGRRPLRRWGLSVASRPAAVAAEACTGWWFVA